MATAARAAAGGAGGGVAPLSIDGATGALGGREEAAGNRRPARGPSVGGVAAHLEHRSPCDLEQWASVVHAFSSQFSAGDNSARQALGRPAVYPAAGSHVRAWSAILRAGATTEWIQVPGRLDTPVCGGAGVWRCGCVAVGARGGAGAKLEL